MACAGAIPVRAIVAASLIAGAGCCLTSGVEMTRPSSGPAAPAFGPSFDASLTLPRTYRFVAGAEWTRAGTRSDLWRLGGYLGVREPPELARRFGWEGTARAGVSRGWEGGATSAGAFGGVRVALLMRLGTIPGLRDDPMLEVLPYLVADVGINGLVPAGQSLQPELSTRLLLRVAIGSALLP